MYLSAVLKRAGHEVDAFILERGERALAHAVSDFRPDLVAFSCTTGIHHWALDFAGYLKRQQSVTTIFGGPHPTFFPEIIEHPSVDIICRGEGEEAIVEIADKLGARRPLTDTLNCFFKLNGHIVRNDIRPLIQDLDSLPNPDRTVYREKFPFLQKSQGNFMARRGCPFRCSFCFNHALQKLYRGMGPFVRFRTPERVVAEIAEVSARWNLRTVYMQVDTFILNKSWLKEFTKLYRERIGLPLLCLVRADQTDEETIAALKYAGAKNIFFGIESGDESLRNDVLKKGVTDEDIRRTVGLLRKHGIPFRTYNMVGLPGETLPQALKTLKLNAELRTDFPWCAIFHPFPGTELGKFVEQSNLLTRSPEDAHPSFFKESVLRSEHSNEIANLQKLFYYGVQFPRLIPLITRAIHLPPNPVFDLLFLVGYAISLYRSENLTLREIVSIGMRNVRQFFYGKRPPAQNTAS